MTEKDNKKAFYDSVIKSLKEEKITEGVDLLVDLMKVRSNLGGNVTEDYVLAYFGEAERDFIRENFENAEFAKNIINRYSEKGYRYKWDEENSRWATNDDGSYQKIPLEENEQKRIEKLAKGMFEFFMIQPHLIAILHRNREKNFLVKLLGKYKDDEEEQIMYSRDDRNMLQKIGDKLKGDDVYEEE